MVTVLAELNSEVNILKYHGYHGSTRFLKDKNNLIRD